MVSDVIKHALISFFNEQYRLKFNKACITNRNRVKYLLEGVLLDLSEEEIRDLIKYYIKTDTNPTMLQFCYEYDEILERRRLELDDNNERKALLNETRKRVEEFRRRFGDK